MTFQARRIDGPRRQTSIRIDAWRSELTVRTLVVSVCMARCLAASNPVCRVKFFNEDNSRLRYLTEDEYNRLIEAAKRIVTSPFLAEKIILSVHTGLRRGSLFHLRWDNVDFLNRVVRIQRTKSGPATCGPPERDCAYYATSALYRALAGLSVRVRARNGSARRKTYQRRQERVPHGT